MILWTWKAFGSGLVATPWQEMLAKVIPVSNRGRFFGLPTLRASYWAWEVRPRRSDSRDGAISLQLRVEFCGGRCGSVGCLMASSL